MSRNLIAVLGLIVFLMASATLMASENPMLVRVDLLDKTDVELLQKTNLDFAYATDNYVEVVAYPGDLVKIVSAGLHYQIVHEDLVSYYQSRNPLNLTMGGFLTFSEILDTVDALHANFPTLVSARDSIGSTWEGRALWVFKISDNVDDDEDEPEVFFNSLIHAREPASWSWQLNFINWLLTNYGTDTLATQIIDEREIWFLPVINPDGYEHNRMTNPNGGGMWRKNRRTSPGPVDLNRNWGYMWGFDNIGSSPYPSDETYRGPEAFSEPETQALRDFIISRNFQFIINAHTYGDDFLYSWGYQDIYTPDQDIFQAIGDSAHVLTGYTPGTAWEVLYNTNGDANDWQYGDQDSKPLIFCATPESGNQQDGFWPSPNRIPQINEQMLPLGIYIAELAGNVRAIAPPAAPVLAPIGEVDTSSYLVTWMHEDEYNPAVAYELVEKSGLTRIEDDLENGPDHWQMDGFSVSSVRYHSSNHSLYSGNDNSYHGTAVMADELTVEEGDTLDFYIWYDVEDNYDYGYVELSTDGGQTFVSIPGNITTTYNPHGNNHGNGITGDSNNQWVAAKFPLGDFVGMTAVIKFSYITDGYVLGSGLYFDDIAPIEAFENQLTISDIEDTFYQIEGRDNGTYYYQVRARDAQDQWSVYSNREEAIVDSPTGITENTFTTPATFALPQNYPNPFNASTEIAFSLASPGVVRLEVFDISGRLVKTLIDGWYRMGNHSIVWDGLNDTGESVASGIYLYKLSSADRSLSRQMVLLK